MKDDEFTLDYAHWIIRDEEHLKWQNLADRVNRAIGHKEKIDFQKYPYTYSVVNAFSINWPYVAYSGLDNELVILNAFNNAEIHRVELGRQGNHKEEINILGTYITDTRDLFTLVHWVKKHMYEVYKLDLDACNAQE